MSKPSTETAGVAALRTHPAVPDLIRLITVAFAEAGIPSPRTEAEWLLAGILHTSRTGLHTLPVPHLSPAQMETLCHYFERRLRREPLQYLLGNCEFYGREFEVSPEVLIPRPESELLAERVIALARTMPAPWVADLGTGSGCLALTLALEVPQARVWAVDISAAALAVARRNAARHGLTHQVAFQQADMCAGNAWAAGLRFEIVMSNPPYVLEAERPSLQPEVRDYEPAKALYVSGDGLQYYRCLAAFAGRHLYQGGWLACEMASQRSAAIAQVLQEAGFTKFEIIPDYAGFHRHFLAQKLQGGHGD